MSLSDQHRKYFPFQSSQQLQSGLPCQDMLLCLDIPKSRFIPFAVGFNQFYNTPENISIFSLLITLLKICVEDKHNFCIETVYPEIYHETDTTDKDNFLGFRFWVPLDASKAQTFRDAFSAILAQDPSSIPPHQYKRRRVTDDHEDPTKDPYHLTRERFTVAINALYGNQLLFTETTTIGENTRNKKINHLLDCIEAKTYFEFLESTILQHPNDASMLSSSQQVYTNYVNIHNNFFPKSFIRTTHLRYIQTEISHMSANNNMLTTGTDLLQYFFPVHIPSDYSLRKALKSKLSTVGTDTKHGIWKDVYDEMPIPDIQEELGCDLISICDITATPEIVSCLNNPYYNTQSEENKLLSTVYTTINTFHLSICASKELLRRKIPTQPEIQHWYKEHTLDLLQLIRNNETGIPKAYAKLYEEATTELTKISSAHILSQEKGSYPRRINEIVSKYFYIKQPVNHYTTFGTMLRRIILNTSKYYLFFPRQAQLFLLTWSERFSLTRNDFTGCSLIIIAGPPDTGKSHACKKTHQSTATSITSVIDSETEQADVSDDNQQDMSAVYKDELSNLFANNKKGVNPVLMRRQTLMQRGYIVHRRTEPHPTQHGKYIVREYTILGRTSILSGTNNANQLSEGILSRGMILVLARPTKEEQQKHNSIQQKIVMGDNPKIKEHSECLQTSLRLFSALQYAFWARHAAGLIDAPDESIISVFFSLLEEEKVPVTLAGRSTQYIKRTAISFMVQQLIHTWYATGYGKHHNFDVGAETEYYQNHAVVTMEHVLCAFNTYLRCTSNEGFLLEIGQIIKELVEFDASGALIRTAIGPYVRLRVVSVAALKKHIEKKMKHQLGALVESLITQIEESNTKGYLNLQVEASDNRVYVFVNIHYITNILLPAENEILNYLQKTYLSQHGYLSFEEDAMVFPPDIYDKINQQQCRPPSLQRFTNDEIHHALTFLRLRQHPDAAHLMFMVKQTTPVCTIYTKEDAPEDSVPMTTIQDRYKVAYPKIGHLWCDKKLFEPMFSDMRWETLFMRSMLTASDYPANTKIYIGPSSNSSTDGQDTYITLPTITPQITAQYRTTIRNIYYQQPNQQDMNGPIGGVEDISDDDDMDDDQFEDSGNILFPIGLQSITFSPGDKLERKLYKQRYINRWGHSPPDGTFYVYK